MNKVTNISNLFNFCYSLLSIPDISKWNIQNVESISRLFDHCSKLTSLPDMKFLVL